MLDIRHARIVSVGSFWIFGAFLALLGTSPIRAQATAAAAAPAPDGQALFKSHCAMCHDPAQGRAPSKTDLARNLPEYVKKALTKGIMKPMAADLSDQEKNAVVLFVTGRTPRDVGDTSQENHNRCATGSRFDPRGPQWNGWSPDKQMTRFQPKPGIASADVPKLKVKWAFAIEGARYGQPSPYGNRVFLGSSSGRFYSLDTKSGCVAWDFTSDVGIRTAPVVSPNPKAPSGYAVYFGDYDTVVYAADANSGKILWKRKIEDHPRSGLTGGFATGQGLLFVPMTTFEEAGAAVSAYPCCSARGGLAAIDLQSGKLVWKTYTIPTPPHQIGVNAIGVPRYGPAGGAIWSAPTVDLKRGVVYVATGDSFTDEDEGEMTDAIAALELKTGKVRWHTQTTKDDNFIGGCVAGRQNNSINCPKVIGPDVDFGASAILTKTAGRDVLVAGQKSGVVYAFNPDNGKMLWQTKVSKGGGLGGIEWGMTTDGTKVYAASADVTGGLFALDLGSGRVAWSVRMDVEPVVCSWNVSRCYGGYSAPPSMIPGIVFSGTQNGHLRAFDAKSGSKVWDFDTAGQTYNTVNGVKGQVGGPLDGNGPTIAGGTLFMISGYNGTIGSGWSNNVLLAMTVGGK